ncbi:hypothetical protein [Streptomyces noursei]|uniref:hypothetical protein n=1 Tax=Streptomyces noursei TaxID=1971 RepID=UPI0023B86D03|nr:hypothetical protein [Streptomyces noursei]
MITVTAIQRTADQHLALRQTKSSKRVRQQKRSLAAERREFRQRHGDPGDWDPAECDLYLGLGDV